MLTLPAVASPRSATCRWRAWLVAVFLACVALVAAGTGRDARAQSLQPLPDLKSPVTDTTGTLRPEQIAQLDQKLRAFEARKGSQIAIVLVPTTEPETIDQYAIRLAEKAKVGRAKVDDGVIILVAVRDQRVRLEIGYGLEGAIPDITASRVRRESINPYFRNGDFFGGLNAGADALIKLIDGEPLPPPRADPQSGFQQQGQGQGSYEEYLVLLLVLVVFVGGILKAALGRFVGSAAVGGIAGTAAWMITSLLGIGIAAGIGAFIFSLILGGSLGGRPGAWTGGRRGGGGWLPPGGGWGGGGGGWSGGGGGGWSGGGGGFGGGGSSGSWND